MGIRNAAPFLLSAVTAILTLAAAKVIQITPPVFEQSASTKLPDHFVGELHEAWAFPSDHLPVGATIHDFHLATWNVLNSAFMDWIEKNTQGLSRSLIVKEHYQIVNHSGLTLREEHTIQNILAMLQHPTHPRSLCCLQECGMVFLRELQSRLPENMQIAYSSNTPVTDQNVIIYNANQFAILDQESKIVSDAYPCNPGRPLMDIVFIRATTGIKYRVINTHVPGDPNLPGRYELAKYVAKHKREDVVTLVMGDMNFDYMQMEEAFDQAGVSSFQNLINYYTIVGTNKCARAIDHIFVDFGQTSGQAFANQPEEVLQGLQNTTSLLEREQNEELGK